MNVLIGDGTRPVYHDVLANWTGKSIPENYTVSVPKRLEGLTPEAAKAFSVSENAVRRIWGRKKGGNNKFTKRTSLSAA